MIFPKVKQIKYGATLDKNFNVYLCKEDLGESLLEVARLYFNDFQADRAVIWQKNDSLLNDEYKLRIDSSIVVEYHSYSSRVYALYTLDQLQKSSLNCTVEIHDFPDLKTRGFMLDISRNKIPTMEEIKKLIRQLSYLKMNHFELYIEGFSFTDASYRKADYRNSLTKEEFKELQQYASIFAVDLVPNMNGLGHMSSWLSLPEYKHLAEKEDGFIQWGNFYQPSTIYPQYEESFDLVKQLYQPLIETATSPYFHMNLDEPFELGRGKSKELSEQIGKGKIYLSWVHKLSSYVKGMGKIPLMWADVIFEHPELVSECPQDLIYCDWGYDQGYPFEEHAKILSQSNLSFLLCPGTSSWNSFTSRYADMYKTTMDACQVAKKYHGDGIITTDWGDHGHIQPILFSYLGIITASLESWYNTTDLDVIEILDTVFIKDHSLSVLIYQLSQYSTLENIYVYNGTMMFFPIMYASPDKSIPVEERSTKFLSGLHSRKQNDESHLKLKEEFTLRKIQLTKTVSLESLEISLMIDILLLMNEIHYHYNHQDSTLFEPSRRIDEIITKLKEIWLKRNRYSYLDETIKRWESLKEIIEFLG
ncbi:MAG: family 20 glycosylhydrolase [Candidatus Izemoplasmatales bacterium]